MLHISKKTVRFGSCWRACVCIVLEHTNQRREGKTIPQVLYTASRLLNVDCFDISISRMGGASMSTPRSARRCSWPPTTARTRALSALSVWQRGARSSCTSSSSGATPSAALSCRSVVLPGIARVNTSCVVCSCLHRRLPSRSWDTPTAAFVPPVFLLSDFLSVL